MPDKYYAKIQNQCEATEPTITPTSLQHSQANSDIMVSHRQLFCVEKRKQSEVSMSIPCVACSAYNDKSGACNVLLALLSTPPKTDSRQARVDELLVVRPCEFLPYLRRMAHIFINRRGLSKELNPDEIVAEVVVALMKSDIHLHPTFEDFRRYITTITHNQVTQAYQHVRGNYYCGNCTFFFPASVNLPSRCGNPELRPPQGQQLIQVDYSTNPDTVIHQENTGCDSFEEKERIPIEDLHIYEQLELFEIEKTIQQVEDALRKMNAWGKRQQKQMKLISLMLEGYKKTEIAEQIGENRSNVAKQIWGENKVENCGMNGKLAYHQAGAVEVFWSVYTEKIFELRREKEFLWRVIHLRDFNAYSEQLLFSTISNQLNLNRREAVEHYIAGWVWISVPERRGGNDMNGGQKDSNEEKSRHKMAEVNNAPHPDFHALLCYAEDMLNQSERKRIAAHVLTCQSCTVELQEIEFEIIPETQRPVSLKERLSLLAAKLLHRFKSTNEQGQSNGIIILQPSYARHTFDIHEGSETEKQGQIVVSLPAFESDSSSEWKTLTIERSNDTHRYLTIFDEDETGEIYLFMCWHDKEKAVIYCREMSEAKTTLQFKFDLQAGHRYQIYLTDRPVPMMEGLYLDFDINDDERETDRRRFIEVFLEALNRNEVYYLASEQEINL